MTEAQHGYNDLLVGLTTEHTTSSHLTSMRSSRQSPLPGRGPTEVYSIDELGDFSALAPV